jgi:hypothetical protein
MAQFGRPNADTDPASWTKLNDGPDTLFYETVDETSENSDTDYIQAGEAAGTIVLKLSNMADPGSLAGIIHFWMRSQGGKGGEKLDVALVEDYGGGGQTTIASWANQSNRSASYADQALAVAAGEVDTITDFTNLFITIAEDSIDTGEWARVTMIALELPDAPVGALTIDVSDGLTNIETLD